MIIIREARKEDLEEMVKIDALWRERSWDLRAFECELSKSRSGVNLFFTALERDSGAVAGFVMGDVVADFIGILNLAVGGEFRKQGIATKLLKRLEAGAFERGIGSLTLEVSEKNEKALNLYKKMGYIEKGRRERYYPDGSAAILMWKKI